MNRYPKSITNVLDPKSYIIASTSNEYFSNIRDDFFNFQIYSSLWVRSNGKIDSRIIDSFEKSNHNSKNDTNIFKNILVSLMKFLFKRSTIITFYTGLSKKLLIKLILISKFNILPFEIFKKNQDDLIKKLKFNSVLRDNLKKLLLKYKKEDNNDFFNLCIEMITEHVSLSILEGYEGTVEFNKKNINRSKYLFSSNGYTNDFWNILCAENTKFGSKLINLQHGGGYGIQLFSGFENYEINIADRYLTMGWKSSPDKKFSTIPSPIVNNFKLVKSTNKTKILFIRNDYPRYFYRMFSHPIGKYVKIYRDWSDKFLKNINEDLLSNILVRLYINDDAGTNKAFKKKYSNIRFDDYSKSFEYQLTNCKVAISDTNQTTYLQSLALNTPTVVFWNPRSTEIRKEAKPYIDMLKRVKILHYSPESAANFLNLNYHSIDEWWMSNDVQNARISFIKNYANISDNWESDWD